MAGSFGRTRLWQYAHSSAIFFATLLFLASFLCTLLWTNDVVHTQTSTGDALTQSFTYLSPAVQTFGITYQTAIFGAAWNAVMFVALLVFERDVFFTTERHRYEIEKGAHIVAVAGNCLYSVACLALMSVLARLAADASQPLPEDASPQEVEIHNSQGDRRAGQGATAAMAGFAAASAAWTAIMDVLHERHSAHRKAVKGDLVGPATADKEA